ncbi:hypothetical protein MHUMG1_01046 [Metarhizium humberi]|uniref:Uncharacterized protein n=1 Tax=Metarhizium humberi TaxID=2596975 RepID=A0A9P8MKT6_9HYPO|nr:hypothetical protein MHUMG1_01046 [Metarhizium humberi]
MSDPEKSDAITPAAVSSSDSIHGVKLDNNAFQGLKTREGAVNFLTVGVSCFTRFLTSAYTGNFRNSPAGCHSIADMAEVVGGLWLKEVTGVSFLVTYIIVCEPGIFGTSVALKALSNHAVCTNYFMLVATALVFLTSSISKFEKIAWLTWFGFLSVHIAVFIAEYGHPQLPCFFVQNTSHVLSVDVFCSGAGTSAFLPVMSEMRKPRLQQGRIPVHGHRDCLLHDFFSRGL